MPCRTWIYIIILAAGPGLTISHASPPGIAIVNSSGWSGDDSIRDGAGEFALLLAVAQQQRCHREVGVVGLGDRHGLFPAASEQSLCDFAFRGIVVVKLCRGGDFVGDRDGLFVDAGKLPPSQAALLLQKCLEKFGAPPAVLKERATPAEISGIQTHLVHFRQLFALAQPAGSFVAVQ